MKANSANRSFFALAATALVPYGLLGLLGCGVLSLIAYRLTEYGLAGLDRGGQDLRPAAAFFAVVAAGTALALVSIARQALATRRLGAAIAARTLPARQSLDAAAVQARLDGRVDLVDDPAPYSFAYGLAEPRVAVSRGLVEATGPDELQAVLHHERYHLANRDTLKVVVARAAPSAFFFMPALGHLRDRYLAGRELAADRHAVRACGERALTGALVKALAGPTWAELGTAAALGGPSFLEHRVEQLEEGREPPLSPIPRTALWVTAFGLAALVAAAALTIRISGTSGMSMGRSTHPSVAGTVLAALGSVACMGGLAAGALVLVRRARGHPTRA